MDVHMGSWNSTVSHTSVEIQYAVMLTPEMSCTTYTQGGKDNYATQAERNITHTC